MKLSSTLEDSLLILSLLSRRQLDWYHAHATALPTGKPRSSRDFRQVDIRRHIRGIEQPNQVYRATFLDIPVQLHVLTEGLFQQLLAAYTSSALRDTIRQTIPYLVASHSSGYFEAKLSLIYSALEGLVDGTSQLVTQQEPGARLTYLLGSAPFDKLRKQLKEEILKQVADQDIADGIVKKLPELRRRAFADRLHKLLEIYELSGLRLATTGFPIGSAIPGIIKRRDIYIHQGKIDPEHQYFDFLTIQGLVELWLLKLLGCPMSAINQTCFQRVLLID